MQIKIGLFFLLIVAGFAEELTVGLVLPFSAFKSNHRLVQHAITSTWFKMKRSLIGFQNLDVDIRLVTSKWPATPTPKNILDTLCLDFIPKRVNVIIYITDTRPHNTDTRSNTNGIATEYLMHLCNSIGLPVIAWNSPHSGEERASSSVILQLAPNIAIQVQPMLAFLIRYGWMQLCCITSSSLGSDDFLRAVKEEVDVSNENSNNIKFEMLISKKLNVKNDVNDVEKQLSKLMSRQPKCRIFLMHSTNVEARTVFSAAKRLDLTTKDYLWIVTQTVQATGLLSPEFPVGLIGIDFVSNEETISAEAAQIFGHALLKADGHFRPFQSEFNCSNIDNHFKQREQGSQLFKLLKNVSIVSESDDNIEFNDDGTLKQRTFHIVNFNSTKQWQLVGLYKKNNLIINDIVWPGGSHHPPLGKPEKFHLNVSFLEEHPYIYLTPPDSETNRCSASATPCIERGNGRNESDKIHCCIGLCIDLLKKLATDLDFSFDLVRVADGLWGSQSNGKWNGLIADLVDGKADIVMTSLKINSQRESAVDFSLPFLETGITIIVAKRTGIISPHAITQPFDFITWFAILVIAIQTAVIAIFVFEWLSPDGFNRQSALPNGHEMTFFQTYWMAWAMLFGAAVNVANPRGCSARFMGNCWALFAVVFIAIYTANLAVFMITKEMYYNLSGLEDPRLLHPSRSTPSLKFGTIPFGNTETIIKTNFPHMYSYMRPFNRSTVYEGVAAVKSGELDAFLYDATVLDHLSSKDDDCRLLTVGKWYSMTGYGIAFPKRSNYRSMFSQQILIYKQTGQLEQWQKFWLSGACKLKKELPSDGQFQALSFEQFISAFVLLAIGILSAFILFLCEHCFHRYVCNRNPQSSSHQCWLLISRNLSRTLNVTSKVKSDHQCENFLCDITLERLREKLKLSELKIQQLENQVQEVETQFIHGTFL
ncbi:hypothetical protein CHUAL_009708 [Chamberlinius hualienensis]